MVRKGFTLIELLVVIAIIAILAAILFPVFTSAKASAQKASCMSNMKQMASGLMLYLQGNNDCFPEGIACKPGKFYDPTARGANYIRQRNSAMPGYIFRVDDGSECYNKYITWMDAIYPYVKSINVFICPSIKRNTDKGFSGVQEPNYGYNAAISRFFDKQAPASTSLIRKTSILFMVFDYGHGQAPCAWGYDVGADAATGRSYAVPHSGSMNVGFADGHVKSMSGNDPIMMDGRTKFQISPYWYIR